MHSDAAWPDDDGNSDADSHAAEDLWAKPRGAAADTWKLHDVGRVQGMGPERVSARRAHPHRGRPQAMRLRLQPPEHARSGLCVLIGV